MSDSKKQEALDKASYFLAEEIRDGLWNRFPNGQRTPTTDHDELLDELEKRVPGFTRREYRDALANGLFESR